MKQFCIWWSAWDLAVLDSEMSEEIKLLFADSKAISPGFMEEGEKEEDEEAEELLLLVVKASTKFFNSLYT